MSTIQQRLESWLEAKGQRYAPEQLEQTAGKAGEECFTCARGKELKRVILTAAYSHLKRKKEREGIMGKIVLVTSDNCPPCGEVVEVLKPLIEQGEIEVVDYSTCEECDREAIDRAGISTFPSMAIRSEGGLVVSPLSLAPTAEEPDTTEILVRPAEAILKVKPVLWREDVEEEEEVGGE